MASTTPHSSSSLDSSSLPPPALTPTFCYTPFALRTFLRQSRAIIDDPISQQLSAFSAAPEQQQQQRPLQPFSAPPPNGRTPSSSRVPEQTCTSFISHLLLPAWNERSAVLRYCSEVAAQEDAGDPERGLHEAQQKRKREMVVDERLDPYSARYQVGESRREQLVREVREETEVEEIIRRRSWGVLRTRCRVLGVEWEEGAPVPKVLGVGLE